MSAGEAGRKVKDVLICVLIYSWKSKIQNIFKINRPLTLINKGDRVMILNSQFKTKLYCTIDNIYSNYYNVKLLPRIIFHN